MRWAGGLKDRPRRPQRSLARSAAEIEQEVIRLRVDIAPSSSNSCATSTSSPSTKALRGFPIARASKRSSRLPARASVTNQSPSSDLGQPHDYKN
jgi:hypothetical protein